jgi:hypothetical protein
MLARLKAAWEGVLWIWDRRIVLLIALPVIAAVLVVLGLQALLGDAESLARQLWDAREWRIPLALVLGILATIFWWATSRRTAGKISKLENDRNRKLEEDSELGRESISVTPTVRLAKGRLVVIRVMMRNKSGHDLITQGLMIDHIYLKPPRSAFYGIPLLAEEREFPATHTSPEIIEASVTLPDSMEIEIPTGLRISGVVTRNRTVWRPIVYSFETVDVSVDQGAHLNT